MAEPLSFGEWLRHRRRELDLTQAELGHRVGCARITIRKIEADQMRPSRQLAEAIMNAMGVPTSERESFIHFARNGQPARPTPAEAIKHNLPHYLSTFVGRENEIAEIQHLIKRSRLVTLTGAGGSGKTRLAIEAAHQMVDQFPEGVWFVSFASLTESYLVQQAIASVLKIRENPRQLLIEILIEYLHAKKLLLILDNCEHLITECTYTAEKLLRGCPQLHILATSREAMNCTGEEQYYVPTLSLPGKNAIAAAYILNQSEAARLFVERAKTIKHDFKLTSENIEAILQICQHVDGIPLAIELAAARVKDMAVQQIASRIHDRFRLLTGGSRTALPRQRTLLATIDWSYNLLSEQERIVLRRLSVFAGGWNLDGAEYVCAGKELESKQIADLQLRLVDKSLVVAETAGNEAHFRMLETIREYAKAKINETDEEQTIHERHLEYLLARGARFELVLIEGKNYRLWLNQMESERDNLRAALGYAIDSGHADLALQLMGSTFWVWWLRGPWSEGQRWTEAALAQASNASTTTQARSLLGLGIFVFLQGDELKAAGFFEQSAILWRQLEEPWWQAFALSLQGYSINTADKGVAARLLLEGLSIARRIDEKWILVFCLYSLGVHERSSGDVSNARQNLEESLGLINLMGDHMLRPDVLVRLGEVAETEHDYSRASQYYKESLVFATEVGDEDTMVSSGIDMGRVSQLAGDNDSAAQFFMMTLQTSLHCGSKAGLIQALEGLGVVAQARGDSHRAIRLFQASASLFDNLRERIFDERSLSGWFEKFFAEARAQVGAECFSALIKEGQAMTLEQAVQYALEEPQQG